MRRITAPVVLAPPTAVTARTRLRVSTIDARVLRRLGLYLGSLAAADLMARCRDGAGLDNGRWAERKQWLSQRSSSRWAGAITKANNAQYALARRGQQAHLTTMGATIAAITARLLLPVGGPKPGYRSTAQWFQKSRRVAALQDRHRRVQADHDAGTVHVVRGGRRLSNTRHHLAEAGLTEQQWRDRWDAARMFLSADGETGKRHGNETIRISPDGVVEINLPAELEHEANAARGRYRLDARARFAHRGAAWAERVARNRAVAYTIRHDAIRDRWYLNATWQPDATTPQAPLSAVTAGMLVGVDTNDDHYAAWRLDGAGNPIGRPRRFAYDLSGSATHRDAQLRHATTRLLHWTHRSGARAVAIENLDFTDNRGRENFGDRKRFRQLISRFPTGKLRTRLVAQAHDAGVAIVAVDPAYTSRWGAEHWQRPTRATRHEAASLVIGRRAQGHAARRRTEPPAFHQSDGMRPRQVQATAVPAREEPRPARPPAPTRSTRVPGRRKRGTSLSKTVRDRRADVQETPLHSG
ncbi:hypothetical protein [Actinoplanes couchii]|uniref:hypothetical protein n=1 Tax=Actinoplanes couchii TaxID=403638 RepID=UPI0019451948|nr:hypothetical protein [Actinoplanes couchii]MDR6316281.1 IS605 OrfB family transposase [Actinoplanes couchii]